MPDAKKQNSIFERSKIGQSYSKDLPNHPDIDSEMLESIQVFEEPLKLKNQDFKMNPEPTKRAMKPEHPMLEGQYHQERYPGTDRV